MKPTLDETGDPSPPSASLQSEWSMSDRRIRLVLSTRVADAMTHMVYHAWETGVVERPPARRVNKWAAYGDRVAARLTRDEDFHLEPHYATVGDFLILMRLVKPSYEQLSGMSRFGHGIGPRIKAGIALAMEVLGEPVDWAPPQARAPRGPRGGVVKPTRVRAEWEPPVIEQSPPAVQLPLPELPRRAPFKLQLDREALLMAYDASDAAHREWMSRTYTDMRPRRSWGKWQASPFVDVGLPPARIGPSSAVFETNDGFVHAEVAYRHPPMVHPWPAMECANAGRRTARYAHLDELDAFGEPLGIWSRCR